MTVSYTHLDVYKRQGREDLIGTGPDCLVPPQREASADGGRRLQEPRRGKNGERRGNVKSGRENAPAGKGKTRGKRCLLYTSFDKMQERIVRFVTENSGVGAQRFRQLMMNTGELVMDVGTVLDGEQAVEEGLIDELGGLAQAVGKLTELIEARIPAQKKGE